METGKLKSMLKSVNCEMLVSVLPADGLEIFNKQNMPPAKFCTILNTDPHPLPGEHWICLAVLEGERLLIFDSLASNQHLNNTFVKRFCNLFPPGNLYKNEGLLQDPFSPSCGLFCVYFFHCLCNEHLSFKSIIENKFTDNLNENECIVLEFVNSRYDKALYKNVQSTCERAGEY